MGPFKVHKSALPVVSSRQCGMGVAVHTYLTHSGRNYALRGWSVSVSKYERTSAGMISILHRIILR